MADDETDASPTLAADTEAIERNTEVVRRLITEVMNAGRLEVLDDLYTPALAPNAARWIAPFQASFPDMRMEIVELIATENVVVGRFIPNPFDYHAIAACASPRAKDPRLNGRSPLKGTTLWCFPYPSAVNTCVQSPSGGFR